VGRMARTLETEILPRLVRQHRADEPAGVAPVTPAEVQAMVQALVDDSGARVDALVLQLRGRGISVASLYLDLLTPAARELGALWEEDRVDFATVTVGLGRLQRLLRQLSPDFGSEVAHPHHGRRVLLTQPDSEQHMFGLSMVAEFFRREGWDVLGGVAGVGIDATSWVRRDWFDVAGFSVGSELTLPWLRDTIQQVRKVSRNRALVVLVGGPVFSLHPDWAADVGADATTDGRSAPTIAETIINSRVLEQSGRARMT
jgi:MerR family transcriptional regulator, light-induced transcriptional regulator